MIYGYTIVYVPDVIKALEFYEQCFNLTRRFVDESNMYAELETGGTALAFAHYDNVRNSVKTFRENNRQDPPAGIEVGFVTPEVEAAFERAVEHGAQVVMKPMVKPWGQTVSYVRDLNGVLVEICSPIG